MESDRDREIAIKYGHRFGQIAISRGFVTVTQVKAALEEQIAFSTFNQLGPHKLIGEILFENGWISLPQIETVLEEIHEGH